METLVVNSAISFASPNYVLPDAVTITSLISPSASKYLTKKPNLFLSQTEPKPLVSQSISSYAREADEVEFMPTPPLSASVDSPTSDRRSVGFFLPIKDEKIDTPNTEKEEPTDALSPLSIHCLEVTSDILVAFVHRDAEIKELFERNSDFLGIVKAIINSEASWEKFCSLLYAKREDMPDKQWMDELSVYLSVHPAILMKFKDIVGYCATHAESKHDEDNSDGYEEYYCQNLQTNKFVDITLIRNHPDILAEFEEFYPVFFSNVQRCGNTASTRKSAIGPTKNSGGDLSTRFKQTLFTPRSQMSDDEWQYAIYEMLDEWPTLIHQLEEIIAYEVDFS